MSATYDGDPIPHKSRFQANLKRKPTKDYEVQSSPVSLQEPSEALLGAQHPITSDNPMPKRQGKGRG